MKTSIRLLGTALGAAALVGTTAVGANAHDVGHHGGHHHYGAYSVRGVHQEFSHYNRDDERGDERGDDSGFTVGRDFDHHWFSHHWGRHHHAHLTFAQRQAAIVQRLTTADSRLSDLISRLQAAAAQDPNGWEAQVVPFLQQQQQKLEALISAVKAATNYQELADAFRSAFAPPSTGSTPPSTPSPSPTPAG